MRINFKHVYYIINIHEKNRKYFVFIIFELKQLQSIRMQLKFQSFEFIMTKTICKKFKSLFEKSFLFHVELENQQSFLIF